MTINIKISDPMEIRLLGLKALNKTLTARIKVFLIS